MLHQATVGIFGFLIEVGDGGRGWGHVSPKIVEKYFSGNYYVKCRHFRAKNHVKFRNFVNFRANIIKIRVYE